MSQWAVEAENLVKKFPKRAVSERSDKKKFSLFSRREPKQIFIAVDGVSLQIEKGEIFGLLGPNGAGKSTMIRMLCTLLEPSSGTAQIDGFDVVKQANEVRRRLGTVLAGERSIYWKLTGRENLEYFAALNHIPPVVARKRVNDLIERMELKDRADELVEKYSTGMRQRVAISKALLAKPPILLLDEPTLGLDPQAARNLRELIRELKEEGHTILLTTHYMEEADQLSDRIGIIDNGKIIALDNPENLKRLINQKEVVRLEISGWYIELGDTLKKMNGVDHFSSRKMEEDDLWEVSLHAKNSRGILSSVVDAVNHNGTRLLNMNIVRPTLEDVFINLTGKGLRD